MERVKAALSLPHDAALARALGMKTSAYANRKRKGSVPLEAISALAGQHGLDLHWLIRGERLARPPEGEPARQVAQEVPAYGALDPKLLEMCLRIVEDELEAKQMHVSSDRRAKIVALLYDYLIARTERDEASYSRFIAAVFP